MAYLGYMFFAVGFFVGLYGQAGFLVVAYKRSLWWFFGCLIVPPVDVIFLILNLRTTIKPFGLSLLGFALMCLGCWISGFA